MADYGLDCKPWVLKVDGKTVFKGNHADCLSRAFKLDKEARPADKTNYPTLKFNNGFMIDRNPRFKSWIDKPKRKRPARPRPVVVDTRQVSLFAA